MLATVEGTVRSVAATKHHGGTGVRGGVEGGVDGGAERRIKGGVEDGVEFGVEGGVEGGGLSRAAVAASAEPWVNPTEQIWLSQQALMHAPTHSSTVGLNRCEERVEPERVNFTGLDSRQHPGPVAAVKGVRVHPTHPSAEPGCEEWRLQYTCLFAGGAVLRVTVGGRPVGGAPLRVRVFPAACLSTACVVEGMKSEVLAVSG